MNLLSTYPNSVFIINRSEIEGRLEAEYYKPEILQLEKKVRSKSKKKLRDFIVKIASGATPSVQEEEKFYSNEQEGIPFLRVQNLQPNGKLYLTDLKYINKETHEGYLKRSQVSEGDLLVKITGVGRMAVASVVPDGFIGNTNQHMTVIRTANKNTSNYLANYLNLDVIEKIASRRATGATRPALDYTALKSIPIIENIDFSILEQAEKEKQQKEAEAAKMIKSIDDYLLEELGIKLPKRDIDLSSRIFKTNFGKIVGLRLDPLFFKNNSIIESKKYDNVALKKIAKINKGQSITKDKISEGIYPVIAGGQTSPYSHGSYNFDGNVITISASGAYSGYVWYHDYPIFASDCIVLSSKDEEKVSTKFMYYFLKALQQEIYKLQQGAGQPHVYARDIEKLTIPIPPASKQKEIMQHLCEIQDKVKRLSDEANLVLATAKQEIEKMIIG